MGADMKAIDLNACPVDFQEKYVNVIKTYGRLTEEIRIENVENKEKALADLAELVKLYAEFQTAPAMVLADVAGKSKANGSEAAELKERLDVKQEYQDAWLDLCQCARSHGLTVK